MGWGYYEYRPYVSQAERKAKAARHAAQLQKKTGEPPTPVKAAGRTAAKSFWGQAWCKHIENFSDYSNRLPRGMTYLRNGSVFDLKIKRGEVRALVSGSDIYQITISIKTLSKDRWKRLKTECAKSIHSLLDLLQGKFDAGVMRNLTDPRDGLLPRSGEISMKCSCPDSASLCKHLAAVMYGVGARLDAAPELLFTLRDVDHLELVGQALESENLNQALAGDSEPALAGADLGELFGIELDGATAATEAAQVVVAKPAPAKRGRNATATTKSAKPRAKPTPAGKSAQAKKGTSATKKSATAAAKKVVKGAKKATTSRTVVSSARKTPAKPKKSKE
ncbi:MAG: SWIM zinc finger family protein [Planctomycetota bacterium]|nr:SWIM zinc finger family protein [Planctomycetota bacterium]